MGSYNRKVDVYSFGVIMYEALALVTPRSHMKYSYQVLDRVERGERPVVRSHMETDAPKEYIDFMRVCWSQDPLDRPDFDVILEKLSQIVKMREAEEQWNQCIVRVRSPHVPSRRR